VNQVAACNDLRCHAGIVLKEAQPFTDLIGRGGPRCVISFETADSKLGEWRLATVACHVAQELNCYN